ncbi:MAG TPA: carboxypeptidase-like regulatory domain-containing protein, partial [Thermoanaerobaculia bacterium]
EAVFELEPITISGRILLGDDPVAAELRFHNHGEWVSVRTDDAGSYRATLWHPGYYTIRIAISGSQRAPFTQHFTKIDESGERDFRMPLTDYTLRVRDAETGAPVAGARTSIGNVWLDEANSEQSLLDTLLTDDSGSATLPPLRAGRLLVTVTAKGYTEGRLDQPVIEGDRNRHELTVSLRRPHTSRRLRLLSPHGQPLPGAEIWAFADHDLTAPIWQASTADDGLVDIVDGMKNALFLIRHPRAATVARRWANDESDVVEWQMEAPAPALAASIKRPGDLPARSARVTIWLDGVRLSGVPLAFATWSSPAADMQGHWVARNLPHRATRLLALPLGVSHAVESRAPEAMATTIPFPWASPAQIRTIE